jgi:hypothetical protein
MFFRTKLTHAYLLLLQHCVGEVLAPDTCSVVERPLPSAQIEWKRIHEW